MTTVRGQLLQMLQTVASALGGELRERLVFVGGCTTALFITDEITLEGVRATDDVDLIADLVGFAEWRKLQEQLRQKGFSESQDDAVICRMRLGDLKVDFMPDDEEILGFSNRWYAKGIETAVTLALTDELNIRRLTPELFVATKLEAYLGRGRGDLFMSRDLEDTFSSLMAGRESLRKSGKQMLTSGNLFPSSSPSCSRIPSSTIFLPETSGGRKGVLISSASASSP